MQIFVKLADVVVYNWIGLSADTHLGEALHFFVEDVAKIFFLLFAMVTLVSFFRSYLDSDKIRNYLEGKPKWIAYILAVLLGAVTPFCTCSSIPLYIGFVEAGIPFGVTMAFLITSPMINEVAMAVFVGVVGVKVTSIYIATGMMVGLVGGILMDKLGLSKYIEEYAKKDINKCCCKSDNAEAEEVKSKVAPTKEMHSFKERCKYALAYSWDIFSSVWHFIVIGIGIGAFLHGYVPEEFFIKYTSTDNLFAVPVAILLGIPLYSSATGVIPIVEALLGKGVPIGTALVMMMSVVAISLPELVILRKVMKVKLLGYFVGYIFIALMVVGYLYNAVF